MKKKYISNAVLTALLISLPYFAAFSKQEEAFKSKGNVPADVFDSGDVMKFTVVKDISTVEFEGTSFLHLFHGVTHNARGFTTLSFSRPERAKTEITIPVNSITGYALGSEKSDLTKNIHMNLESDVFPDMNFKILQVLPEKSDTGPGERRYLVRGDLTIHGVTRSVIFTADMEVKGGYLHVTGEYNSLNMKDFGVEPKPLFAVIKVSDIVDVRFDIYEELSSNETSK